MDRDAIAAGREYIRRARARGMSDDDIRRALVKAGWSNEALEAVGAMHLGRAAGAGDERHGPRSGIHIDTSGWHHLAALAATGNQITSVFSAAMPWRIRWSVAGDCNFAIWLHDGSSGEQLDLLVNEIGPGDGTAYPSVPADRAYLSIEAEGQWEAAVEVREQVGGGV